MCCKGDKNCRRKRVTKRDSAIERRRERERESERVERTESRIAGQKAIIKPGEMFRNMHNIPLTQLTFIQHFIAHIGVWKEREKKQVMKVTNRHSNTLRTICKAFKEINK